MRCCARRARRRITAVGDFVYMPEVGPDAYILSNRSTAGLHHSAYDLDNEALPYSIGYCVNLVETALAA